MKRFAAPAWRIAGSFVSWAAFTFFFMGLFQVAGVVIGLGGFCASGGPYVIETECPEAVVLFAPLGIFGMIGAVVVGLVFAREFGTPLVLWAWPILFIGLGGQFFAGAFIDGQVAITNIFLGLMFVVMGFVPLWWSIRAGVQPFLLGNANPADQQFTYRDAGRKSYFAPTYAKGAADPIPPTPADWALTLGILVVAIGLGGWLSVLAFNAVGSAG
jgi:hypothetical protein